MNILKKPLVTEKISSSNESGVYGFFVNLSANKIEIKKEIKRIYGVDPIKVNTMRYAGKKRTKYTKKRVMKGSTSAYKKVVVFLKKGDNIDFYNDI